MHLISFSDKTLLKIKCSLVNIDNLQAMLQKMYAQREWICYSDKTCIALIAYNII